MVSFKMTLEYYDFNIVNNLFRRMKLMQKADKDWNGITTFEKEMDSKNQSTDRINKIECTFFDKKQCKIRMTYKFTFEKKEQEKLEKIHDFKI